MARKRAYITDMQDNCVLITLRGVWTKTKAGGTFCQRHGLMVSTCQNPKCGKQFHSERVHSKTCSDKCRKALSRKNASR